MTAKKKTNGARMSRESELWLAFGSGAVFVGLALLVSEMISPLYRVLTGAYLQGASILNPFTTVVLDASLYVVDAVVALLATILTVALLVVAINRLSRRVGWTEAKHAMGIAGGFMIALALLNRLVAGYIPDSSASGVMVGVIMASFLGSCFAFAIAWQTAGETLESPARSARKAPARRKAA